MDDKGGYNSGNQKTTYHTGDDHDHEDGDGDGDGSKQLKDNLQHWWFNGQGSFLQERGRGGGGRGSKEHPGPANYKCLHKFQFRVRPSKCDPIFDIVVLIKT